MITSIIVADTQSGTSNGTNANEKMNARLNAQHSTARRVQSDGWQKNIHNCQSIRASPKTAAAQAMVAGLDIATPVANVTSPRTSITADPAPNNRQRDIGWPSGGGLHSTITKPLSWQDETSVQLIST